MRFPIRMATLLVASPNHIDTHQTSKRLITAEFGHCCRCGHASADAESLSSIAVACARCCPGAVLKPGNEDGIVARSVTKLLPKKHISARPVDDQISSRALDTFEKMLDPMKLYFMQSDIDELNRYRSTLDDSVIRGDLSPAYEIFSRFLKRVNERVQVALTMLDQDFEFTSDETIVIDPK